MKIGGRKVFGLKKQDTKGSAGFVPEKKRFALKEGILGQLAIIIV